MSLRVWDVDIQGEHHIHVNENITPVIHAARKVALRARYKKEVDRLGKLGIVEAVKPPMKWISSCVMVEKANGDLRICLDPKDLNKAIQGEHLQLPMLENITSQLAGATTFSSLDASSAFYQIKLDKVSSELTCFNTLFGRYKFLRLHYGMAWSKLSGKGKVI